MDQVGGTVPVTRVVLSKVEDVLVKGFTIAAHGHHVRNLIDFLQAEEAGPDFVDFSLLRLVVATRLELCQDVFGQNE